MLDVQRNELRELGDVGGEGARQLVVVQPQEEELVQLGQGGGNGGEPVVACEAGGRAGWDTEWQVSAATWC